MDNPLEGLLAFLALLREERVYFSLESDRNSILVVIPSPSKYFEIEFFADGHIEVQTFGPSSDVDVVSLGQITEAVLSHVRGEE